MSTRLLLRSARSARNRDIKLADKARDQKNPALAARLYRDITERWGPDFGILVQLGNALKDSGAYEESEGVYSSALRLNPTDADCHLQFGHLMKLRGDVLRAREHYTKASQLDPHLISARQELEALEQGDITPPPPQGHVISPPNVICIPSNANDFDINELNADAQTKLVLTRLRSTFQWRRD